MVCVCVCVRACAWGQPCLMYTSTLVLDYWIVSVVAPEQATAHVTPLLSGVPHSILAVVATCHSACSHDTVNVI